MPRPDLAADVVVAGSGPAGLAVADHCARLGLSTLVLAPHVSRPWRATYGVWSDQCAALPSGVARLPATRVRAGEHLIGRGYSVLDNDTVLAAHRSGASALLSATVVSVGVSAGVTTATTGCGRRIRCGVVVDATGRHQALSGGGPRGPRVEQTAYGLILPAGLAGPLVEAGEAVFMDWGTGSEPTFLYAVPLPGGRTLLEETSLARRPGMPQSVLRDRLLARLAAAGVRARSATGVERVRFAVDVPPPRPRPGVVAFGVAGGMLHPASGYSVGESLLAAPAVAAAIADGLPGGSVAAARAARAAVWPRTARTVRWLRVCGLRTLLAMNPASVPAFFDDFFRLPDDLQRAYLSERENVAGTAAAMTALFRTASWDRRVTMATGWMRPRARSSVVGSPGGVAQQR